jgi:hypothetical protein
MSAPDEKSDRSNDRRTDHRQHHQQEPVGLPHSDTVVVHPTSIRHEATPG